MHEFNFKYFNFSSFNLAQILESQILNYDTFYIFNFFTYNQHLTFSKLEIAQIFKILQLEALKFLLKLMFKNL
jgi:hypothetical protein